jgi:CBS domain-containing protein
VLALKLAERATSTLARLRAARAAGIVTVDDEARLERAQALFLGLILEQQSLDIAAGGAPSVKVEVARLTPADRRQLKSALRDVGLISRLVEDALSARP